MTKTYNLSATHHGETKYFRLDPKTPLKLKAKANSKYKIYDDEGNLVHGVRLEAVGDDVYVYAPQENGALLLIEDYQQYVAINDLKTLINNDSTLMLTQEVTAVSSIQKGMGSSSMWLLAGAGAIGIGAALGAGGKGSSGSSNSSNTPTTPTKPTPPPEPTPVISINPITDDNTINNKESESVISVTGTVSHAKVGDILTLKVGTTSQTATITDGKFTLNLAGKILAENKEIIAEITRDGKLIHSKKHGYDIDIKANAPTTTADHEAQIYLNDVKLDLAEEIGSVRLSGKLDFANSDSMYKWGHNKDFIRSIALKIGDKEFMVGINNDYSFYLDLTHEQYQSLKGKDISYELFAHNGIWANWMFMFDYKADYTERWVWPDNNYNDSAKKELAKVQIKFDDNNIQNSKLFDLNINTKKQISGKVVNAKSNDEIIIKIGDKEHKISVNDDLTFSIQVENSELNNLKNIQATLNTKNDKGENISVSDIGYVLQDMQTSENFVNPHESIPHEKRIMQHTDPNYNFPYFIHANAPFGDFYGGFTSKLPFAGVGEPVTIKYYFVTQEDYESGKYQPTHLVKETWSSYSEAQKEVARNAYKQISDATNIKFIETANDSDADTRLMMGDHIGGWAGTAAYGGNVWISRFAPDDGYYKQTLIHEISHTLGIGHSDYILDEQLDYAKYDMYGHITNMSGKGGGGKDGVLRAYDLAYLHYRFGVNPNHNSGNDVYRFQNFTDKTSEAGVYIWDGAGIDTFDASQEKEGVTVDLTPGSWVYRGEKVDSFVVKDKIKINDFNEVNKFFPEFPDVKFIGNVDFKHEQIIYQEGQAFIGYGTQLENLIGSNYADTLKGNKADNNIFGGTGNDTIYGDDGNDYLDGGKGADTLTGGWGDDIFVVDDGNDVISEFDNQGIDSIYSFTANYTLSQHVENISLFGTAQNATGNDLDNVITGNDLNNTLIGGLGSDTINGGRGSDVLTGGAGADTFVFSDLLDGSVDVITDFDVADDKITLSSTIFDGLTQSNAKEHIKYDKDNGQLHYQYDSHYIHFATLSAGLDEKLINYNII